MIHRWELKRLSRTVALAGLLVLPATGYAQSPPPDSASKAKPAKHAAESATQNSPDQPTWDPVRAEKDLEVGKYYMHKGDLDAAIDRFQDAALAKPGYALPYLRLGEAQEKKGLRRQAIKSYTKYLDLLPHADDKDKVQKKIDKLYKEVQRERDQRPN